MTSTLFSSPRTPTGLPDPTILTGQLAPSSLTRYRRDVAAYLRFCGDSATALLPASLARWRTLLAQETRLSPHTINRRLAAVKRLLQEGAAQGLVEGTTAEAFRRVPGVPIKALKERLGRTDRPRITPGQMRKLCETPDLSTLVGWRDRALLHTLASSGCRISEVVTLTARQLIIREGHFFLSILGKHQTTAREAPLSQEAYAGIQAWLARRPVESPFLFTRFAGRRDRLTPEPLSTVGAWKLVHKYAPLAGLAHVSPHDFRRFVGTELAKRDLRMAQKALGHQRIETTARHYVLDELAGGLTDGLY
jgi:integrase